MNVITSTTYTSSSSNMSTIPVRTEEISHIPTSLEILTGTAGDLEKELSMYTATLRLYLRQNQEGLAGILTNYDSKLKKFEEKAKVICPKLVTLESKREGIDRKSRIEKLIEEFRSNLNIAKTTQIAKEMQKIHDELALSDNKREQLQMIQTAAKVTDNLVERFSAEFVNNNEQIQKTVALITQILSATKQTETVPLLQSSDDHKAHFPIVGKYALYNLHF